jgi:aspartate aminotransferase-like enzyme
MTRHRELGRMARAGLRGLGLRLLTPDLDVNAAVTAAWVPDGIDAEQLVAEIAERYGVQLASGNGHLVDRGAPHRPLRPC